MRMFFKLTVLAVLLMFGIESYAQMGVTSYSIYAIGINTSRDKQISGELKTFANNTFDDLLFEVDGFYNFKPSTYHRFSIGLGVNLGPQEMDVIHAFTVPVALEIYPLQDFKKVSILFELTPEFVVESDVNLRSLWGIRYSFGGK